MNKVQFFVSLCSCVLLNCHLLSAQEFRPGKAVNLLANRAAWLPTGADNSLTRQKGIFRFSGPVGAGTVYQTKSEETNIHSHYRSNPAKIRNYTYTGDFRVNDQDAGIGVTFYSDFPKSDTYYRLRRMPNSHFLIAPHPDSQYTLSGTCESNLIPKPGKWYSFKIIVKTSRNNTKIRAKVWRSGASEPGKFQINCQDFGSNRIKSGKPGIWSMAEGKKLWRNLKVTLN